MSDSTTDQSGAPAEGQEAAASASTEASQQPNAGADVSAASSPAEGVKQPAPSMEAVIKAEIAKPAGESPPPKTANTQVKPGEKPQGQPPKPNDPLNNHPRFKELHGKLKTQETATKTAEAKVQELAEPAERWKALSTSLTEAQISPEQLQAGIQVMVAFNTQPERAREMLLQQLAHLDEVLGEKLPPDLKQAVDEGRIDPETARGYSRERAKAKRLESTVAETRQAEVRRTTDQQREAFRGEIIQGWNAEIKATSERDPDYAAKRESIEERMAYVMQTQGNPKTAADAVKLFKDAYRHVSDRFVKMRPPQQALRELPVGGKTVTATPQFKSMEEAIRAAM